MKKSKTKAKKKPVETVKRKKREAAAEKPQPKKPEKPIEEKKVAVRATSPDERKPKPEPKTENKPVDERKRAERRAMGMLAAVALVFCGIFGASLAIHSTPLDENNCPIGANLASGRATSVLIDLTDDIPVLKRGGILRGTKDIISSLNKYERFSLFVLRPNKEREFAPIFSACNPGQPEWSDYLTKGRRQLKAEFEKGFNGTLESALNRELASKAAAQTSPIIESIKDISQSQYWGKQNRLFIFSDMLEHSSLLSLYRMNETFEGFLRTPSGLIFNGLDLQNAGVVVCPTDHPAEEMPLQMQASALTFFKKFFTHAKTGCLAMSCQKMAESCAKF